MYQPAEGTRIHRCPDCGPDYVIILAACQVTHNVDSCENCFALLELNDDPEMHAEKSRRFDAAMNEIARIPEPVQPVSGISPLEPMQPLRDENDPEMIFYCTACEHAFAARWDDPAACPECGSEDSIILWR